MTDIGFVRSDMVAAKPAPIRTSGVGAWLRKNLFATPLDGVLTILGLIFLIWVIPPVYNFFIGHAVGPGGTVLVNGANPQTGPLAAANVRGIDLTGGQGPNWRTLGRCRQQRPLYPGRSVHRSRRSRR